MSRIEKKRSIGRFEVPAARVRLSGSGRQSMRRHIRLEALEARVVMTMPGLDLGILPKGEPVTDPVGIEPPAIVVGPQQEPPAAPPMGPIGGNPLPPKPENDPSRPVPSRTEVVVAVPENGGYASLITWATTTPGGEKLIDWTNSFTLFEQGGDRLVVLKLNREQEPQPVLDTLNAQPFVSWAAPNLVYPADSGFDPRDFVPNDPQYGIQWHHPLMGNTQSWDVATSRAGPLDHLRRR